LGDDNFNIQIPKWQAALWLFLPVCDRRLIYLWWNGVWPRKCTGYRIAGKFGISAVKTPYFLIWLCRSAVFGAIPSHFCPLLRRVLVVLRGETSWSIYIYRVAICFPQSAHHNISLVKGISFPRREKNPPISRIYAGLFFLSTGTVHNVPGSWEAGQRHGV